MAIKRGEFLLMLVALNAQALDAADLMNKLTREKRVLLIFAPGAQDPGLQQQEAALASDRAGLAERDMAVIRALAEGRWRMELNGVGAIGYPAQMLPTLFTIPTKANRGD